GRDRAVVAARRPHTHRRRAGRGDAVLVRARQRTGAGAARERAADGRDLRRVRAGAAGAIPRHRQHASQPPAALDGLEPVGLWRYFRAMRKTPVVMGVLSMVFGGVVALMTGVSLASQPFSKQMMGSMGKAFSGLPRAEGQPDVGPAFEH